jgi:chaperonin cofactor prefoldin
MTPREYELSNLVHEIKEDLEYYKEKIDDLEHDVEIIGKECDELDEMVGILTRMSVTEIAKKLKEN